MSTEWQIPEDDRSSGSGRRWRSLLPLAALVVVAAGAYLMLGLGGSDGAAEDVVLGGQTTLGDETTASEDRAASGAGEPPAPGASAVPSTTDTVGDEPAAGAESDLTVDEDALVFDPSYVTGIAAAVSQQVFPDGNADNIILASDMPTGDALAAGSLVGLFDTTLLLTATEELSPSTAAEIDRLGQPRVHILGGPDAVSEEVESQLVEAGHAVHRHAGPRQEHTAVDIAGAHFTEARTAVLLRTPDRRWGPVGAISTALAATSLAAAQDLPILLTSGDALSDTTETYLEGSLIRQMIVVGNEDDISADVTSRLREIGIDWLRWSGEDRFATAVEVARNRGFQNLDDAEVVVLVEGDHDSVWPTGLLGTVQASHQNGPVLLTQGTGLPAVTAEYLSSATPGSVDVVCTPGVTRQACAAAMSMVGGDSAG